eukprot:NODE_3377_length_453_cov_11.361386_g2948_i0.p5 GENE.NODE_3377_length_453_cov_11.361386_g2948_i0~~NODE_3377_length_453_cov_11.361386_g2948_i0.p5  ORF type:complete len:68 (-),score=21.89 NODE_3377_length_453_cov_11.361386_g2948_i0:84-287(-)
MWAFGSNQEVANLGYDGQCLDIPNMDPTFGIPVGLWQCNGGGNQQWSYDSVVHAVSSPWNGGALGVC